MSTLTAGTWYGWVPDGWTRDGLSNFALWKIVVQPNGDVTCIFTNSAGETIDSGVATANMSEGDQFVSSTAGQFTYTLADDTFSIDYGTQGISKLLRSDTPLPQPTGVPQRLRAGTWFGWAPIGIGPVQQWGLWKVDVDETVRSVSATFARSGSNAIIRQGTLTVTNTSLRKGDQTLTIPDSAGGNIVFTFTLEGETLSFENAASSGGGAIVLHRGTAPPPDPTPVPEGEEKNAFVYTSSTTLFWVIGGVATAVIVLVAVAVVIKSRKNKEKGTNENEPQKQEEGEDEVQV
jgi:hypothetical protein